MRVGRIASVIVLMACVLLTTADARALTKAQALQILAEQVLMPSAGGARIVAQMTPSPLSSGFIQPVSGGVPIITITGNPKWFALVDLFPGALFMHSVTYVLIDDITGAVTTFAADDWPEIDFISFGFDQSLGNRLILVFPTESRPSPIVPGSAGGEPLADYGDAPDGQFAYGSLVGTFPSFFATTNSVLSRPGAHALTTGLETLGVGVSVERDVDDISDPDGLPNLRDADSDERMFVSWDNNTVPPTSHLIYDVTVSGAAPDVDRFINALFDFDRNGSWSGAAVGTEWAVVNQTINVTPGTTAATLISPAFSWGDGVTTTPTQVWIRVALTRAMIAPGIFGAAGWDGSGAFEFGEIEDHTFYLRSSPPVFVPPMEPPPQPGPQPPAPGAKNPPPGGGDPEPPGPAAGWDGSPITYRSIIVQGNDNPGQSIVEEAADTMDDLLGAQGYDNTRLEGSAATAEGIGDAIDAAVATMKCEDRLLIYIIAHGYRNTAGGKIQVESGTITGSDLSDALDAIPPCSDLPCDTEQSSCNVTVIIESCFAGQWEDAIKGPGRTVATSSTGSETSKGSRDGSGGEYSDQYAAAAQDPASDTDMDGSVDSAEAHAAAASNIPGSIQTPGIDDQACDCFCPISEWLFFGEGEGGSVEWTVDGEPLSVVTFLGQTAEQLATAIAAAINGSIVLSEAGVLASASGSEVFTNGQVDDVIIDDPGFLHFEEVPTLSGWLLVFLGGLLVVSGLAFTGTRIRAR